jgi:hypothetical protein
MVRNGHNVSICIWYEMVIMYRSAYGTKWLWYENDFHYGTKMIFTMVRNSRYEMTIILKIHTGTFVCETIRGFALTTVLTQCFC